MKRFVRDVPVARRCRVDGPARQRGQAMPFALAFGAATALAALVLFNSGMLANAKTRLQNAADAGAYSAGVLQARDHNFSALTNRAMVANQAAVAQIVSLKSYLEDASQTHKRMSGPVLTTESQIPASKPAWNFAKSLPIETLANTFNGSAPTAVEKLDKLISAYEAAQEAHHVATAIEMVMVADEVIKRNDPNASVTKGAFSVGRTAFQVKSWKEYTSQRKANDTSAVADRFADVVVNEKTTDSFTQWRDGPPTAAWASTVPACMLVPGYLGSFTAFGFAHAGGTLLSGNKRTWLALDSTLGAGVVTCWGAVPCPVGVCPWSITLPPLVDGNLKGGAGGGRAGTGKYELGGYKNNPTMSKAYGGAAAMPAGILKLATGPGPSLDPAGGLQNYYRDVTDYKVLPKNQSPELNSSPNITIEVERKAATIRTSSKLLTQSQQLKLQDGMKGDTMRALSSAQSYFYRSTTNTGFTRNDWARPDGKSEMANLFSPYWQTRLVDRSLADRAASWAAQ